MSLRRYDSVPVGACTYNECANSLPPKKRMGLESQNCKDKMTEKPLEPNVYGILVQKSDTEQMACLNKDSLEALHTKHRTVPYIIDPYTNEKVAKTASLGIDIGTIPSQDQLNGSLRKTIRDGWMNPNQRVVREIQDHISVGADANLAVQIDPPDPRMSVPPLVVTPLIYAAIYGFPDLAKFLLRNKNVRLDFALGFAVMLGHPTVVNELLKAGAKLGNREIVRLAEKINDLRRAMRAMAARAVDREEGTGSSPVV